MGYTEVLSFLVPPFPFFIEGNVTTYRPGEQHPNRYRLGYFDVIIVKEGTLYLGEEDCMWTMDSNHALILEPDKHHFPVKPCLENTSFYWFHFQTNNSWLSQTEPQMIIPKEPVSKLHYYAEHTTIHLPKYQQIVNSGELFEMLDLLLSTTLKPRKLALWETQQTFMKVLQSLENNQNHKDSSTQLAEQIEIYLKQNYKKTITNKELSSRFHVHENYLARCMKTVFHCTPLEYLLMYRLEQARSLLLQTDWSIQRIAEETAFSQISYFSRCFKKRFGVSPQQYRKQHSKPID